MDKTREVTTNVAVKRQLTDELNRKGQTPKREDLISQSHKIRGMVQDLRFLKLRNPGLDKAVELLEQAQQVIEEQIRLCK